MTVLWASLTNSSGGWAFNDLPAAHDQLLRSGDGEVCEKSAWVRGKQKFWADSADCDGYTSGGGAVLAVRPFSQPPRHSDQQHHDPAR